MSEETTPTPEVQPEVAPDHTVVHTPTTEKHSPRLLIVSGALVVVALSGLIYFARSKGSDTTTSKSTPTPTAVASASPTPGKISFTIKEPAKLLLTGGYADATLSKTATGYRMYVNTFGNGPGGYLAYTSQDGSTWTKETGIILAGAATARALTLDNGVRLYYPGAQPINLADPPADMYSTFSTDGVTFTKEAGVRLSPQSAAHYLEGPTVFQLADGTWRMYFNENTTASGNQRDGKIWGATSSDGLTWTRDSKVTIESEASVEGSGHWPQVLHPFVIKKPSGGFLMIYNSHSELFSATSADGISWKKHGKMGIHGADADGYFQTDGTLRLFYGDHAAETSGVIYTVVVTMTE